LWKRGAIAFNEDWVPERNVRLGELMGSAQPELLAPLA